jgi:putative addiction module component (TIGR02574 family)
MNAFMSALGIDRLSVDERLVLIEEICASIAADSAVVPLTEGQRAELQKRIEDDDAHPDEVTPWEPGKAVPVTDYARYYYLERYLFEEVSQRFASTNQLTAFDFFCIVVWKANRSKSRIAKRLLAQGHADLPAAVQALTGSIASAQDNKARLRVLIEDWGFRLPMASAILTVLFPEGFTVYDIRVCEVFNDFKDAQYKTRYEDLWLRYSAYLNRVRESVPSATKLRDKDRCLWGRSFRDQLQRDIENGFRAATDDGELEA